MADHAKFYRSFVQHYDEFFPCSVAMVDRVAAILAARGLRHIVDVGCGTGSLVVALRRGGIDAVGIDPSTEMIDIARGKLPAGDDAQQVFQLGGMENVASAASVHAEPVLTGADAVLCLGNSAAHAGDRAALSRFFSRCAAALPSGGILLLQGIDYDGVARTDLRRLPEVRSGDAVMQRGYGPIGADGTISFTVAITGPEGRVSSTTTLLAVGWNELRTLLADAGFGWVERIASLSGSGESAGIELVVECGRG